jgi:OPA family sugar phosphate sensor protein UhpC-like MFS transporter
MPMIQKDFGVTKAQTGVIASYSTIAYAVGKIIFGPLIDRFGGRICFLLALAGVAVFGGLGASALSLPMLTLCYSANRFSGAAGWGSMVKQVPDWFPPKRLPLAMAFLSLSFVFGGVCALLVAGRIAALSGDNWRAVMGVPSVFLVVIIFICWLLLPSDKSSSPKTITPRRKGGFRFAHLADLAGTPQFWIVCGLSFTLTITRETFNVWTVDFFKTEGGAGLSNEVAAFLSTPFDAAGAVGILLLGWLLGHVSRRARNHLLFGALVLLALLIYCLPAVFHLGLWVTATTIALIGLLSYGPYSLLAGIFSVEIRGKEFVGTVAGFVDASGYFAGVISGYFFGKLLDQGGYRLGFHFLALVTLVAAMLCLFLTTTKRPISQS